MMNRSIVNAACAFAALSLLATTAHAACEDSPKVRGGVSADQKAQLLSQCKSAGTNMHSLCDKVPACSNNFTSDTKAKFVNALQICINARKSITTTWYAGQGDEGHDIAIDNKINQLNKCLK